VVANRGPVLRFIDGVGEGGWGASPVSLPGNAIEFPIKIEKDTDENTSLALRFDTIPWDNSQPGQPWSMELFPFDSGLARSKMANRRSYAFAPANAADSTNPDVVVPSPNDVSLTLTSAAAQGIRAVQYTDSGGASAIYCIAGTSVYKITSGYSVSNERALGATGTWLTIIAGELFACIGGSGYIRKRTASGTWSTSADVRAYCMEVVKDKVCRVGGSTAAIDNQYSECSALGASAATTAFTVANYNTAAGYYVGDLSWQTHSIWDFAGTVACGRGDGLYMPNPETKFLNQTPQIKAVATPANCKGSFAALGYFWVPYARGLLRLAPGFSEGKGPETLELPNVGFLVRGGFEWDRAIWMLATDEQTGTSEYLIKMVPDRLGISDADYIFHVVAQKTVNSSNPGQFIVPFVGSGGPTQPSILFGGGTAATAAGYVMLGRGSGRGIEDTGYRFKSSSTFVPGTFSPDPYGAFNVRLVGFKGYMTTSSSKALTVTYGISSAAVPSASSVPVTATLTTQEGGGSSSVTATGQFTLYAATDAITQSGFFRAGVTLAGDGTSSTAHASLHRLSAFGYMHPQTTDEITCQLLVGVEANRAWGMVRSGWSDDTGVAWLRRQVYSGRVFSVEIPGYEESRTTRCFVKNVSGTVTKTQASAGIGGVDTEYTVTVKLVRVDFANAYASGTGVTP